jgi:hypothetical protein
MSTDFENELRDLFREKAGEAPLATPAMPASAPPQVLRRGRLHQVGTVLGSAAVVVALIVGSVAGLTRILGEGEDDRVGSAYEVFQRTATIEAFTVASPSDWYLVNEWPLSMLIAVEGTSGSSSFECQGAAPGEDPPECQETPNETTSSPLPVPQGLPMLQLSNVDLGLSTNACEAGLPGGAAVLYVALDYDAAISGIADPSIPAFPPGTGLPPEGDGPCGPGRYAHFTVNGERFFSWIGVGSDVNDADRETIETSYEMMSAIPDWTPTRPNETTPGYVIGGGEHGPGDDWRIELRPDGHAIQLSLDGGPAPDVLLTDGSVEPLTWIGTDPIFGVVTKRATGVEFRPGAGSDDVDLGRSPAAGTIMPVPPTLSSFDLDLFFIDPPQGYGELGGRVVALGVDAEQTVSPPPAAEPRTETVEFSGTIEGHEWAVSFRGSFADRTACIYVDMDGERQAPLCPTELRDSLASGLPSLHGWLTSFHLLAGPVPSEVVEIRFVGDDDAIVPQSFQCETGPLGWTDPDVRVCALLLPPDGSGTVEYLDAAGGLVSDEGILWGTTEPEVPTPVEPMHGGVYWAVYPWIGAAGDREADDVSAELFAQFGIEAFPGDLACDQGAAEALGTDAEQGIGVYFETDDEANAFALQAGLLDHTRRVIARVTTYCLD